MTKRSIYVAVGALLLSFLAVGCSKPPEPAGKTEFVYAVNVGIFRGGAIPPDFVERAAAILKSRAEGDGRTNIEFKVIDRTHIQITVPTVDVEIVKGLVVQAGILDFRITFQPQEVIAGELLAAEESLKKNGPGVQVQIKGSAARWFAIHHNAVDKLVNPGYVTSTHAGTSYILCYDDSVHIHTHSDLARKPWAVAAKDQYADPASGMVFLPFSLDPVGASYMSDLSAANTRHPMAILLDDCVMSAPILQSRISDQGVITCETMADAQEVKRIMDAGSLPAVVLPDPISVRNIPAGK